MLAFDPHAATNRRAATRNRATKPRVARVRSRRPAIDLDQPLFAPFAALFSDLRVKRLLPDCLLPLGDGAGSEVAQDRKIRKGDASARHSCPRSRLSVLTRQLLQDLFPQLLRLAKKLLVLDEQPVH